MNTLQLAARGCAAVSLLLFCGSPRVSSFRQA